MAAQRSQRDAEREETIGPALLTLNMIRGQGLTETKTHCSKPDILFRITSYNVCYTKLLRAGRRPVILPT